MPAEVPDRGLRLDWRRHADFCEQHVHFARFERRETGNRRLRGARELLYVKLNRRIRVHRIEVKMMEAWRWKSIRLIFSLGLTDRREYHPYKGP
jgi:hypothetical protein